MQEKLHNISGEGEYNLLFSPQQVKHKELLDIKNGDMQLPAPSFIHLQFKNENKREVITNQMQAEIDQP